MSCCGNQRTAFRRSPHQGAGGASSQRLSGPVDFAYSGGGQLSVTGPYTGVIYRFTGHGQPVRVHAADAASLASVPGLAPVRR